MDSMKDYIECVRLKIKHKVVQLKRAKFAPNVRRNALSEHIDRISNSTGFAYDKFDVKHGLNRKLLRNFQIQRRIDLHGYTQDEAFNALLTFFAKCQLDDIRNVLVITGGNAMKASIIRDSFRRWVRENFSIMVASYCFAKLKDGGQGAFYVVIRKKN